MQLISNALILYQKIRDGSQKNGVYTVETEHMDTDKDRQADIIVRLTCKI